MRIWYTCYLLLFLALQSTISEAQVSGIVVDSKSEKPLDGCHVFINHSSVFSTTDENGFFDLQKIDPGFYDLIIYKDKYEIFKSPIRIKLNEVYKLNIPIGKSSGKVIGIEKNPETIPFQERTSDIDKFKAALFDSDSSLAMTSIVNEKDIKFKRNGAQLIISMKAPVEIDNLFLGYKMHYYFQPHILQGAIDPANAIVRFESRYAQDQAQQMQWMKNRLDAFRGSARHLYQSIISGDHEEAGFELYDEQNVPLASNSLLKPSKVKDYYNLNLPAKTRVVYHVIADGDETQNDNQSQTSWIHKTGSIDVSTHGILLNQASVQLKGKLEHQSLIALLPIKYVPQDIVYDEKEPWRNYILLQEKVYLHTDRDYYYPRETIWFKAYMGYSMPALRDTLSRFLYVDLINPAGQIISTKHVRITKGVGWGEIKLPQNLDKGEYYLRAYTNWMLNYHQELFTKPIPILAYNENLIETPLTQNKAQSGFQVRIVNDKKQYRTRELVSLSIDVLDPNGNTVPTNFSISVIDSEASVEIPEITKILEPNLLKVVPGENRNLYFDSITHLLEHGVSIQGKVIDQRGKNLIANLDIVQGNMENLISLPTNTNGEFTINGLDFTDSLYFAFKSTNDKGKPIGKVELVKKEKPEFNYHKPRLNLKLRPDDAAQRVFNTYDLDKNTIMLEEVLVEGKAIKNEDKFKNKLYGHPDHVVKGSEMWSIAGINPLASLQGKVPGLRIAPYRDDFGMEQIRLTLRGGRSSFMGDPTPLILVDGNIWSFENLMGLSASSIDYVEIVSRASPIYGGRGVNGIIAIYTKQGADYADSKPDYTFHKIGGYSRALNFTAPDYSEENQDSNPDFRTTIYWNPYITTGEHKPATVAFYAADVETKYKVIVEGITLDGKPFRGISYITVSR